MFDPSLIAAFLQVVMIDLVLAGDNAIVIGMAAAGLPKEQRNKVIMIGIIAATVLRILLALVTVQLLQIIGLLLAGGVLLLWVSWKLWRELMNGAHVEEEAADALEGDADNSIALKPQKSFRQAVWQIIVADLSMSLDNVLAVGGAAREHPYVLIFGLALSIALMGLAATLIARLLQKYRWIAYVGLVSILYVSFEMIWRGWKQVRPYAENGAQAMLNGPFASHGVVAALLVAAIAVVLAILAMILVRRARGPDRAANKQQKQDG